MPDREHFLTRAAVILIMSYLITVGATFTGVLTPEFQPITLSIMTLTAGGWLIARWRGGWRWHRTALDGVFVLWIVAIAASWIANPDVWRRSAIGLWYVGLYIGVWYLLHDALTNKRLRRETLIDGVLIGGLVVLLFGYAQLMIWARTWLPLLQSGKVALELPRLVSTPGNANSLGNFLVVLLPFAVGRFLVARIRLAKIVMGGYALLTAGLLFLTFSRGAWIGAAVGLGVLGGLVLAHYQMLSRARLAEWWRSQSGLTRLLTTGAGLAVAAAGVLMLVLLVRSFGQAGRSADLRTEIWQAGIELFREKPLTGHGLFTFGRGLVRYQSTPPQNPHSHAHNAPIHIAAELGLIGLAALAVTLWVIARTMGRNWRNAEIRYRLLLASVAAVVGFAVHQLLDVPAMMPMIALVGLVALLVGLTPNAPQPVQGRSWRVVAVGGSAGLWLALIVTGVWSGSVYRQYVEAARYGLGSGDYRGAAEQMEVVIQADPNLALYDLEQGFFYGLAASEGDNTAALAGISAYERFVALEPGYAMAWANLGALYGQLGLHEQGLPAARRAAELAPESWQLAVNLAQYAQAIGEEELARESYDAAVRLYPDASLYPDLTILELWRMVSNVALELS
ncbi:MAG: O-antigen ligase family protein, partial [Anaerolineae bacterium]|nr:O-antigen ligase family protein [Anaerolineae bacterium]